MRPLVWKELRQGRPLLLFSVIAALALAAAHVVAVRLEAGVGHPPGPGWALDTAVTGVLLVLPLFFALLAGSGLFAAEADHGTIPVLFALPLSRRRIWALKALCGLILAGVACVVLLGTSRWLMAPVYDRLPLRPWPDIALSALAIFATAVFTTVLTPHVVGATVAAIPLAIALAIGGRLLEQPGGMLLGYDYVVDIELWAALAAPALLYASVRAVMRGGLLEWNRSALLQLPLVLLGIALTILVVGCIGRAATGYSRQNVRQINADPAEASPSAAVVLSYSRPVPYQRGRTMVASQPGDPPAWQAGVRFERRPLDWEDPTAGSVNGGPLYRNTSAVILDLKSGRELGVVRQALYTHQVKAAVSGDGSVAAVAGARRGLTWGDIPWDRGARVLTIVDLRTGKRLYSGVPEPLRGGKHDSIGAMSWSPHGRYLALEAADQVYLLSRDGASLRAVGPDTGAWAWSPNEDVICVARGQSLLRLHPDTGSAETVWRWPFADMVTLSVLPSGLSPDGRWAALTSTRGAPTAGSRATGITGLHVVGTDGHAVTRLWGSYSSPSMQVAAAWSQDSRTLYVLLSPAGATETKAGPQAARLLRWRVGDEAATELGALPYPAATLTPLAGGGVLVYPVRQFEEKQYTMRVEPVPPTGGPIIAEASGSLRPFPDARSSLAFAADNELVTVDAAGRVITVEGRPGSKVVRAWEVGGGGSVQLYP